MELLTVGELARTVLLGLEPPGRLAVQVLAKKPLNGNAEKQRLKLWDGETVLSQTVLEVGPGLAPPDDYSVVLLEGVRVRRAGDKWAAIISGYSLLRAGGLVGRKLEPAGASEVWGPASLGDLTVTPPAACSLPSGQRLATPAKATHPDTPPPGAPRLGSQVKRNLSDSFESPEPKRPAAGGQAALATHTVADITPYTNKFTVKVLVERMGTPRKIETRNYSGSVLDCVLTDSSGQIKLTAWGRAGQPESDTAKMESALRQGATYLVTGAKVGPVKETIYNTTGHHYELTWSNFTRVEGPLAGQPVQINYKLVPLAAVTEMEAGAVVDVAGWVRETGPCHTFTAKSSGREVTKREVVLADSTAALTLTLWAKEAEAWTAQGRVVALRGAKLEEFQGMKKLKLGFESSFEVEPVRVPGVAELVAWAEQQGPALQAPGGEGLRGGAVVTLAQLQQEVAAGRGQGKFLVAARPTRINTEGMFYLAHRPAGEGRCRKKVEEGTDGELACRCGARAVPRGETALRYMVRLCLADCSTYEWAVMFEAESLFGMSAAELQAAREASEERFQQVVQGVLFKEQLWSVAGKVESYQGESRVKVTVEASRPLDWEAEELARLWGEVGRMEAELGVRHQEEWNIDLKPVLQRHGLA
jgi:replication factor A1